MRAGRNEAFLLEICISQIHCKFQPVWFFSAVGHFTGRGIYVIDYNVLEHGGSTY